MIGDPESKIQNPKSLGSQQMRQRRGCVEINQRSLRWAVNSRASSRNDIIGLRGGISEAGSGGGVIQPFRTASAKSASSRTGLRVLSGGTSSATTRSRSVTRTVSPLSANRTYPLSLFSGLLVLRISCTLQSLPGATSVNSLPGAGGSSSLAAVNSQKRSENQ
jgi:hypothetical protein